MFYTVCPPHHKFKHTNEEYDRPPYRADIIKTSWSFETIGLIHSMDCVKRKCAFQHAQNAQIQIILCMRKVSSGRALCSPLIHFNYPMILLADNEGPNQTARMRRLIWAFVVSLCPKTRFRMERPNYYVKIEFR